VTDRRPEQPLDQPEEEVEVEVDAAPDVKAAEAEAEPVERGGADASPDLAELGRRYAAPSGFTETLRDGFRELKRHPAETKHLVALLRGLARKHEPEARRAVDQITRVIESIQKRSDDE
jgi:hypothetical protein